MKTYQLRVVTATEDQIIQPEATLDAALEAIISWSNGGQLRTVTLVELEHREMFTYTDPRYQLPE